MKSRSREMLNKSIGAMLAAIEVYNKPTFAYREETFSILAVTSWELLLKARILQLDRNRISAIIEYEKRQLTTGVLSQKLYRKKNRTGNHITLGVFKAYDTLVNKYADSVAPVIRLNLEALTEVRDNAVHFLNKDFGLRKKVHELGTGCLKNYLNLVRVWFGRDLSEYQIFLMPVAFLHDMPTACGIVANNEEKKVLEYIRLLEKDIDDATTNDFNLSIRLDIQVRRVADGEAPKVVISKEPGALPVTLQEEDIRERYPWDYAILTKQLSTRYGDFVNNASYHQFRKSLEGDERFCKPRFLDPGNPKSAKKNFYNPNILKEFDKHYRRQIESLSAVNS